MILLFQAPLVYIVMERRFSNASSSVIRNSTEAY